MKIGFIGLGIMGRPMAKNLIQKGFSVKVFNRSPEPSQILAKSGAQIADSPADAAQSADAVITILPDDRVVESVCLGENGILEGIEPEAVAIDMSTTSPDLPRKMAPLFRRKGAFLLDAPVSGGDVGAQEATLSIMAGGNEDAFNRMLPVFKAMGRNISHVGDSGAGQIAKCANQMIVALSIEAVAEALLMASRSGVDPEKVRAALMGGFAQSRVLEVHGRRMTRRQFTPGARVGIHQKDTRIALDAALKMNLYLPGVSMMSQLWNAALAQDGGKDWDHSGIVKLLELMSNTTIES